MSFAPLGRFPRAVAWGRSLWMKLWESVEKHDTEAKQMAKKTRMMVEREQDLTKLECIRG